MQELDDEFFYSMDINAEGMLRNVVWVHRHCKLAYRDFYDVISFDTTYKVNRYNMPLATFVGVNHHGQSILLGCGLLSSEDTGTFNWLFSTWLTAMGGLHPLCFLTDQSEPIRAAIAEVMPNTIHRLCIWHIYSKVSKKLMGVHDFSRVKSEFYATVQEPITVPEFEARWSSFINNNGLQNRSWLQQIYEVRERWVPVYLNDFFWAGMRSTQRSEGMHAFFDSYVGSKSTLQIFVSQYEMSLSYKHEKELLAEMKSKNTTHVCLSRFAWEEQLERALTSEVYLIFRGEVKGIMHCIFHTNVDDQGNLIDPPAGVEIFRIEDTSLRNDFYNNAFFFTVEYRVDGQHLNCDCKMFETTGVVCRHIMCVMKHKRIQQLNERYILRRWRKDQYRPYLFSFRGLGYPQMTPDFVKHKQLADQFEKCTQIGMHTPSTYNLMKRRLEELRVELVNMTISQGVDETNDNPACNHHGDNNANANPIRDPRVARSAGRPRNHHGDNTLNF